MEAEDKFGANAGAGPALENIWRLGNVGGVAYTNFVVPASGGGFGIGAEVRTVSVEFVGTAQDSTTFTPIGVGDTDIVAFSASRAIVRGFAGVSPILDVVEGRLFLARHTTSVNPNDPSTWVVDFSSSVFAEYVLGPQGGIISGSTFGTFPAASSGLPLPASLVNAQTPDAVDAPKSQLNLVFLEDSTDAQNAGSIIDASLETYQTGDNWLHSVDGTPVAGLEKASEGFFVQAATVIQDQALAQIAAVDPSGFNDVDIAVLNSIAAAGGLGFADLDNVAPGNQAFSSLYASGSGQPAVYSPAGGVSSGSFNGDAISTFSTDAFIVNHMVDAEAALGDFVWHDQNANGVQDIGEPGIAGATVNLKDSSGTVIATTTTDASGFYSFTGLTPGTYSVQFVQPAGFNSVSPLDAGGNDAVDSDANPAMSLMTATVTLAAGETNNTLDAGFYKSATIGDFVWNDLDADGVQDAGEPGIDGVGVRLYDAANNLVASTATAGGGAYLFSGLRPGNYHVEFDAVAGFFRSPQDQSGDDTKDSDASLAGVAAVTTLVSGETDRTWDAGLFQPAVNIVKLTNGTDNDSATGPFVPVGSTVTWTYLVTNPTQVSLANVAVTDNQAGVTPAPVLSGGFNVGDTDADNLLDNGETWQFTASGIAVAGQYANIGTVVATPTTPTGSTIPGAPNVTDENPDHYFGAAPDIHIVKLTNGTDNNTPTGPVVPVGSTVTFTYVVTNTGNVPLANVAVKDDNGTPANTADDFNASFVSGDTDSDGLLDLTETWTYTASRIATAGQYENFGTVTGNPVDQGGNDIPGLPDQTDTDVDHHFGAAPGINIVKLTNGTDNNTPTGPQVAVGSTVVFTYIVTNTGNVPLAGVTVSDDKLGPVTNFVGGDADSDGLLDLTETWTYSATTIATAGQYVNTGTVTGNPVTDSGTDIPGLPDQTDSDIDHHFGVTAGIDLEKLVQVVRQTTGGGEGLTPGFWKTHSEYGPAPLKGWPETGYDPDDSYETIFGVDVPGTPTLLDALSTGGGGINALLRHSTAALLNAANPNVDYVYTESEVIAKTQAAINSGDATLIEATKNLFADQNELGADLTTPATGTTTTTEPEDADEPSGPLAQLGDQVVFIYEVTNTGDVPLTNVVVTDVPLGAVTNLVQDGNHDGTLDVGEKWVYTVTITATATGVFRNDGTVTAQSTVGSVTDTDAAHYHVGVLPALPGIDVEKLVRPVATAGGGEGLTPGFWKTHSVYGPAPLKGWPETGLSPDNSYRTVFGLGAGVVIPGGEPTLLQALSTGGGGAAALLRHSTAALLNARNPNIDYAYTEAQIKAMVAAAFSSGDFEATKNLFAAENERGADLSTPATGGSSQPFSDADSPTGPIVLVGASVEFEYLVRNTGDGPVSNVVLTDDGEDGFGNGNDFPPTFVGGDANNNGLLDVGETWRYVWTLTVTEGQHANVARVTGTDVATGAGVNDEDAAYWLGLTDTTDLSSLSGSVYVDQDNDGAFDFGEAGIGGVAVTLTGTDDQGLPVTRTATTDANGHYSFAGLRAGTYTVNESQPANFLDGKDTAGSLGILTSANDQFTVLLPAGTAGVNYNFGELPQVPLGSLSGIVYVDSNGNGTVDLGETAIAGVTVELTGQDDLGPVSRTVLTDADGAYLFLNLRPGTYQIHEVQPQGYLDGTDSLGSLGGMALDDVFKDIAVNGLDGINYNFGEQLQAGSAVQAGQAATIGFWQNKNGQALIRSLNGGENSNALGNWLASNFGNMFGELAGKSNDFVAKYYRTAFKMKGMKLEAQVLAVALAAYVTDADLAGTAAVHYGFTVDQGGLAAATYNVGSSGLAFNVANNTVLTVWEILKATNELSKNDVLYFYGDTSLLRKLANTVYDGINRQGDIG